MKKLIIISIFSLFIFSCDDDDNPMGSQLQCESFGLVEQDGFCVDDCGIVNGDNSICLDQCGIPNGDNSTCLDQCGVPNGDDLCVDECGVPNGSGYDCGGGCSQYVELWGECYNIQETTNLDLSGNSSNGFNGGLTGNIPSEIGSLINLTSLNLRWNELTGEIPIEIWNLTNLTYLNLGGNYGSNGGLTGNIPSEIGNLINLTYLNLDHNQLTGEIPSEIWNLINLTVFRVENNQFYGEISPEIGNLTNLTYLCLYGNQLSGEIPSEICNQGDSTPSLEFNQLCPPYPECISQDDIGPQNTSNCP